MTLISTKQVINICLFIFIIIPHQAFCQDRCEDLKNGIFYSYDGTFESIYYRSGEEQKEINTETGDSSIWQIKWLDNCNYTLKLIKGNSYTDKQILYIKQHLVFVKILNITDQYYTYESHFDKLTGKLVIADTLWLKKKPSLKDQNIWPKIVYSDQDEKINLYENGKWEYAKENDSLTIADTSDISIAINKNKFLKDKAANYLVKSKKLNVGVYINSEKWGFTDGGINEAAEFDFSMKKFDIFASLITEKTSFSLENLADLIFQNAKDQAPDAEIIKKEYRIVNGLKILCLQMRLTIKGMRFIYFSYNFSNKNGAVQLSCVTNESLFKKNYQMIENFLNGLGMLK
jgi:hypothetical protein